MRHREGFDGGVDARILHCGPEVFFSLPGLVIHRRCDFGWQDDNFQEFVIFEVHDGLKIGLAMECLL